MILAKVNDAAVALEQAFLRTTPPNKSKRMSEESWQKSLKQFHQEAKAIRQNFSLGFFARAKVAYLLQQRLISAGIGADTVRKVIFALVLNSFSGDA